MGTVNHCVVMGWPYCSLGRDAVSDQICQASVNKGQMNPVGLGSGFVDGHAAVDLGDSRHAGSGTWKVWVGALEEVGIVAIAAKDAEKGDR